MHEHDASCRASAIDEFDDLTKVPGERPGRLLVVNIGSNVGDFDASRLNDMCESGRRALTRLLAAPDLLTLLVEPNPTAYRELERAAARHNETCLFDCAYPNR